MDIKEAIEKSKDILFKQYKKNTFEFFNERDAITRFLSILRTQKEELFIPHPDNGFSMLHQEYPIPEFVKNSEYKEKGWYDIVILSEKYILANKDNPSLLSQRLTM